LPGTEFAQVLDSFMQRVQDYKLVILYNTSVTDFQTYCESFLLDAVEEFSPICDQSLANSSSTFTETLTQKNIRILSMLMTRYWLQKEVNDVRQMSLHLQDKDFRTFSEANHLREKQAKYNSLREELSQELVNYKLNDSGLWSDWITDGIFYQP
jgi:hypothetical protein